MKVIILIVLFTVVPTFSQSPAQIENELLGHLGNLEKWSGYGGSSDYDRLDKENTILKSKVSKYTRLKSTLKYDFKKLKEKMAIVTSKDGQFRVYSWDAQLGGSAHWQEVVFQYIGKNGRVYSSAQGDRQEGEVCSGFYHQIFQTATPAGQIYLLNSTAACSNALAFQYLQVFQIDSKNRISHPKLIKTKSGLTDSVSFEYDFFSVVDRPERPIKLFFYDEPKRSFRFPVVVEDKKFINGGRVTDKFISYKFNGKYYERQPGSSK